MHRELVRPLEALRAAAKQAGFALKIASGFRSFQRQLAIWNGKALGERPVLDANESPIDIRDLNSEELMFAILRWSAIPGTSRHHWGSEVDVYDAHSFRSGEKLELTLVEACKGGIMASFHQWLCEYFNEERAFSRPYFPLSRHSLLDHVPTRRAVRSGVSPEPWHLSYRPLAQRYEKVITKKSLADFIAESKIALKDEILHHFDFIYERYVKTAQ